MDSIRDAIKLAALQENSQESNALRSLLLGLCQQCSVSLQKANSYQELILDELDARHGNTAYLEKVQRELSSIQTLVAQIIQELPPTKGERLPLGRVVGSVLDCHHRNNPDAPEILRDFEEDVFISGDLFELQSLILGIIEGLDRLNSPEPPPWKASVFSRHFSRHEASMLRLKDEGEYCVLAIEPTEAENPRDFKRYRPFVQSLEVGDMKIPPIAVAQWCGGAAHNNATLLYDEDLLRKSAILIFPRNSEESQLKETYQWQPGEAARTILLVDDEDMIWDVLSDMLQELGYQVILAGDGKEAVEIYSGNPGMIDLVILDMLMPNMGGQETFFMLKELNPDVKVLASSGYVSQEEIQDVMDAGASGFLRKPYHMADLARKIKEIFEK